MRWSDAVWLRTSCELTFDIEVRTPLVLMLRPRSGTQQWIAAEQYQLHPSVPVEEFTDSYGNLCQRLIAPPGSFSISTVAEVQTADFVDADYSAPFINVENLPNSVLNYLLPSRYCESDRLTQLAAEITAYRPLGYAQVVAISAWLNANVSYDADVSRDHMSALEVNVIRRGVCRDIAHLGIALCRSICIPARMVVGYLYNLYPMDLHSWFEAYVGGRWYAFDASQAQLKGGYVAIGYGRDAADVAVFNQFGPEVLPFTQHVKVEQIFKEPC